MAISLTLLAANAATYGLIEYWLSSRTFIILEYIRYLAILNCGAFLVWLIHTIFVKPWWLSPLTKLPQPKGGNWLNGHFWEIFWAGTGEVERQWLSKVPNDGFIYYRHILNTQRVVATTPQVVQQICARGDDFVKPLPARALAGKVLGEGLVLSELDKHKQQRRVFLSIFAPRHVREMLPLFWAKTCEVTVKLTHIVSDFENCQSSQRDGAILEVGHWASRTALDIVTMATLGEDFRSIQDDNAPLATTYRRAIEPSRGLVAVALLKIFLPEWLVDSISHKWNRKMDESVSVFRGLCRTLLRERRQLIAAKMSPEGKDLLSLVFRYEEVACAPEEELIDQMTTFLAAGHETISVAITWAIYMLCLHPDWQTILRKEARAHLPNPNDETDLSYEQKESLDVVETSMPMTQAFVNEVLRFYPPIPQTMREPLRDVIINGQVIPKGTWVIIPFKGLHRDERFWGHDAKRFNPRRWLNSDGSLNTTGGCTNKFASLSFLQGNRSCVAQGFSKAEMVMVVATWTGRFDFKLVDPKFQTEEQMPISIGSLSAKPLHGLDVKWKIINGWRE